MPGVVWLAFPKFPPLLQPSLRSQWRETSARMDLRIGVNFRKQPGVLGGQIAGAGRVLLSGGSAMLAGRTTLNGQWEWNSDGLGVYGTGEVSGPVPLNWTAGRMWGALTIAADGVLNLRGGTYLRLSSGPETSSPG